MRTKNVFRFSMLAFCLLAVSRAGADQISWSYDFSLSTSKIQSNGTDGASGSLVVMPFAGSLTGGLPSSATITAVNLEAVSKALAQAPAQFAGAEYTLTMRLTDLSSGLTAAVTFEGVLNGTVSASGTSLKNTFLGQTAFSFDLNHHIYDISVGQFRAPGAPGSGELGSIGVDVSIRHNPEPSSVVLAAMAMPALAYLRRNRKS